MIRASSPQKPIAARGGILDRCPRRGQRRLLLHRRRRDLRRAAAAGQRHEQPDAAPAADTHRRLSCQRLLQRRQAPDHDRMGIDELDQPVLAQQAQRSADGLDGQAQIVGDVARLIASSSG